MALFLLLLLRVNQTAQSMKEEYIWATIHRCPRNVAGLGECHIMKILHTNPQIPTEQSIY